jgi:hypothetical protein
MTTIAANSEGIAADSFIDDGNVAQKIYCAPGGSLYYASTLARWYIANHKLPEDQRSVIPPWDDSYKMDDDDKAGDSEILILTRKGLFRMDGRGIVLPIPRKYAAIGSGADVALGALFYGHTPVEAVEASAAHDANTKLPVVFELLVRRRPKKKESVA